MRLLDGLVRIGIGLILLALATALASCYAKSPEPVPRATLIGYGCGPDKLTLHRDEEDQFPTCERIERQTAAGWRTRRFSFAGKR